VTLTPEESRITVFSKGMEYTSRGRMPTGGQEIPSSIEGDSLLSKNAQKKLKKKNTSDKINKRNPERIEYSSFDV
jgi:hypothetical protein